jgi:hypothetical protein
MPIEFPGVLPGIRSELTAVVLDTGQAPETVIKRTDPWQVETKLHLEGGATRFMGGKFKVSSYLESIGSHFEGQVGETKEMALNGSDPQDLTVAIEVPKATEMSEQPKAGAYKLTTVVTYVRMDGVTPDEIAGFVDGPVVQLYDPIPV